MLVTVIDWELNRLCLVISGMQTAEGKWPVTSGERASVRHPILSQGWEVNHNRISAVITQTSGPDTLSALSYLLCCFCLQFRLLHPDTLRPGKVWPAGQTAANKSQSLRLRDAPAEGRSAGPVQTEEQPAWNMISHWSKRMIVLLVCSCIYCVSTWNTGQICLCLNPFFAG